jgi:predicted regulator of Ras-like GTPase activity (Roadblock/LC7/MglB family)
MTSQEPAPGTGFRGDVSGLSLSDIIQLNGANAFSGCITARQGDREGRIFFREGRVIHAEQGGKMGEDAFIDIMEWRSGHFRLEPNIATTSNTIKKNTQFLLMDAHRVIDERRAHGGGAPGTPASPPAPSARPPPAPAPQGITARLRTVPGVRCAALVGKDAVCVEDRSFEAETLGGEAVFLATVGNRVGAALAAGELRAIAADRSPEHLLVFVTRTRYLAVRVDPQRELGAAEADVIKLLGAVP